MKRPGFAVSVVAALCLSVLGSGAWQLQKSYHVGLSFETLVALLSLTYVAYLLSTAQRRAGQLSLAMLCLTAAVGIWLWSPSIMMTLVLHCLLIWLVRAACCHSGLLPVLLDLGLCALALLSALWAADRTGSLFATLWCFFLVHALYVVLPARLAVPDASRDHRSNQFEHAFRVAEEAARRLSKPN